MYFQKSSLTDLERRQGKQRHLIEVLTSSGCNIPPQKSAGDTFALVGVSLLRGLKRAKGRHRRYRV